MRMWLRSEPVVAIFPADVIEELSHGQGFRYSPEVALITPCEGPCEQEIQ